MLRSAVSVIVCGPGAGVARMVEITNEVACDFDLVNVGRCSFGRRSLVLSWLRVFWFRLWVGSARSLPPSISFSAFRACIYSLGEFCSLAPCGITSLLVWERVFTHCFGTVSWQY